MPAASRTLRETTDSLCYLDLVCLKVLLSLAGVLPATITPVSIRRFSKHSRASIRGT